MAGIKCKVDLVIDLLTQTDPPSHAAFIAGGCTTFPEHWDMGTSHDVSQDYLPSYCHTSYTGVAAWFYRALAGILPDENAPGFKHIILAPQFTPRLQHVSAGYPSPYGFIESAWRWEEEDTVIYSGRIPNGTMASLDLSSDYSTNQSSSIPPGPFSIKVRAGKE
jgi:alpha-L-rhamnosidase